MRSIVISLLVASTSLADVPKRTPPSEADQKKYTELLRKGRELQGKHKWQDAITAFKACVDLVPEDATALGELGWTAYLAKDLKLAETATRQSLAGEASPNIRGASLYNLGLIEEASGKKPDAIAAYTESLKVRPNGIVRAALAKLSPEAANAFDPFKPVALAGPFPSLDAYCKTTPEVTSEQEFTCWCKADDTHQVKRALAAPFEKVETVSHFCGGPTEAGLNDYALAIKVAAGWYVETVATVRQNRWCTNEMKLSGVAVKDVAASPGPELLLHFAISGSCEGGNGGEEWTEDGLVVAGGTKAVSATPLIVAKRHEISSDVPYSTTEHGKTTTDIALDFTWSADGTVIVKGKTTGLDKGEAANVLGKHTLVFP